MSVGVNSLFIVRAWFYAPFKRVFWLGSLKFEINTIKNSIPSNAAVMTTIMG
jgi:hypothetical protein